MKVYRQRRVFQTVFLVAFFGLLTLTVWPLGRVYLGAFLVGDPLIAATSLANGIFKWEMLLALVVIAFPLLLGRVFCGYVCPLGFIVELTGPRRGKPARTRARELLLRFPPYALIVIAGLLAFGSAAYLVFDPLSLLTRSSTVLVYPFVDRALRLGGDVLYLVPALRRAVDAGTTAAAGLFIFQKPLSYQLQFVILGMLAATIALSLWQRRAWCRHLCPLGALLGLVGRFSLFGRVVEEAKCVRCGKCEEVCPLDAIREEGVATDKSRCQLSFECADICPTSAIRFGMRPRSSVYSPSRRAFLATAGTALVAGYFVNTSLARAKRNPYMVRPPGARREVEFLSVCARCGQCMKVCPTNVLQPSVWRAGVEGIFTPEMDFVHSYCDFSCNECGKVCPTGAINALTLQTKRRTKIGRAYIDHNSCIPWADFKNCLVCQELCPTPEKAIVFSEEEARNPDGKHVVLKRPVVIEPRCIGCGICEFNCPVRHEAAIRVRAR